MTLKDRHGFPVVNPILKPMRDTEKRVTALADQLGFTPNSRKKLMKKLNSLKKEEGSSRNSYAEDDLCD